MAEITERGFTVPEFSDKADVPNMVRENVTTAEKELNALETILAEFGERFGKHLLDFQNTLDSMNEMLGVLSDELDAVNGEGG